MLPFKRYILSNGLKVLIYSDKSTPLVTVNILYNVGARDEDENLTGFAHLFEHLMFGGSANIPNYDKHVERAGGENNAFTNNDITNYYLTVPHYNLETALWLESDRMLNLAFSPESLEVQRKVVIEEFKQRYLNQPYGDLWLHLRPLAFKDHPYRWATIGKDISHIENAILDDVKAFYSKWYNPSNAILVLAGHIDESALPMIEKWFGSINKTHTTQRNLPVEKPQNGRRELTLERNVPSNAIYMAFHMPGRMDSDYYRCDIISELLSGGNSSRLYRKLMKDNPMFSDISAYITGDFDPGLFVIEGRLLPDFTFGQAEKAILEELEILACKPPTEDEMTKVKNKALSIYAFQNTGIMNVAMNLAYFESLGDAELINSENDRYFAISARDISDCAKRIFHEENTNVIYYQSAE